MAFVSFTIDGFDTDSNQQRYTFTDSQFGSIKLEVSLDEVDEGHSITDIVWAKTIVKEYGSRNLLIGRNLALYVLWYDKKYGNVEWSIDDTRSYQDDYCSKYIENWAQYAKERDEHLKKLMVLR